MNTEISYDKFLSFKILGKKSLAATISFFIR